MKNSYFFASYTALELANGFYAALEKESDLYGVVEKLSDFFFCNKKLYNWATAKLLASKVKAKIPIRPIICCNKCRSMYRVTSHIVKNNHCVLPLLSHEEANVRIEQQKDTHRHPSPAHFPSHMMGRNWVFEFHYEVRASYLTVNNLYMFSSRYLCLESFLVFHAIASSQKCQMP